VPSYDLGKRLDPTGEGVVSTSPSWLICVVRFKHIATFDRSAQTSWSRDASEAAAERQMMIIRDDCLSVMTSSGKGSHVKNLVATLAHSQTNYAAQIMTGDWLFCWMAQDSERIDDIARRLREGKACNDFLDGLKFMGRVYSCRRQRQLDPGTGQKRVSYALQGNGFTEFNAKLYWDPYMSVAFPDVNTWMGQMGVAFDKFLSKDGIDINGAIPELVELLFGRGISKKAANPDGDAALQIVTGLTEGEGEAPFSYVVPMSVGKIMGRESRSKSSGVLAYADLLGLISGVQKYEHDSAFALDVAGLAENPEAAKFVPTSLKPMLGSFLPAIPQLSGRTVWSVLRQYLNEPVNEMYTCLRTNDSGKVLPTLVVRQLPFTTEIKKGDDRTAFLELPRWTAPESMLYSDDIGRSDALRINFVHLLGQSSAQTQPNNYTYQLVRSPPVRDDQDIRRSGLQPDIQIVACGIEDQERGPKKWMELRADMVMGQHLTLNGTLNMVGVQEPICEGDNFELDGVVFHIESVQHTCAVGGDGKKRFMTTLALTSGMLADPDAAFLKPGVTNVDQALYPFTGGGDELTHSDPGHSGESTNETGDTTNAVGDSGGLGDFFTALTGAA
jgi:hypothetical protein